MEKKAIITFDFDTAGATKNINDAKLRITELKKEQEELAAAGGESSEAYLILSAKIKDNNDKIKENTKYISDSIKVKSKENASIADMRKALSAATYEWNNMTAAERKNSEKGKDMQVQIKALTDNLKELESSVGDNRRNVGNYGDALKGLGGPVGKAVEGFKGFNATLTANPIGAVVMVLKFLYDAIKDNAVIADQISFIFSGINSLFRYVKDTVVELFTNFDKLGAAMLNPIKFFKDLAVNAADAAKEGYNAAAAMDAFTVTQAKLNGEIKQNEQLVRSLTYQLKDKTKTEKERIAIAEKIADLELENAKKQVQAAQAVANAEMMLLKGKKLSADEQAKLQGMLSDIKIAKSEAEIIQSQKQTRINILLGKEEKAALHDNKDAEKDAEKREAEFNKEIERRRALIAEADKELEQARIREQKLADQKAAFRDKFKEDEKISEMDNETRRAYLFEKKMQQLREAGLNEMDILKLQNIEKQALMDEVAEAEKASTKETQEAIIALRVASYNAAADLFGAMSNLVEAAGIESEAAFEAMKALDTATALIKGFLAVQKTLADPLLPFPSNVIAAAGIGVTTAANVVKIQKTQPKFEEGGNITGPSHDFGGVPIEAEGGEVVINKQSAKLFWRELNWINRSTGGRSIHRPKFALGGNVGSFDGGFSARGLTSPIENQAAISRQISEAMKGVNIVTRVSDIRRVEGADNFAKSVSELR